MPFQEPNFTQIPNELLGNPKRTDTKEASIGLLAKMDECELKVVLVLCRITFGYHLSSAAAAKTWLCKMTGLTWPSVQKGLRSAIARGLVKDIGVDDKTGTEIWEMIIDDTINAFYGPIKDFNSGVKKVDTINKEETNTKEKDSAPKIPESTVNSNENPATLFKKRAKAALGQDLAEAMLKAQEKGRSYTVPASAGGADSLGYELVEIFRNRMGQSAPKEPLYTQWEKAMTKTVSLWGATPEQAKQALQEMLADNNKEVGFKGYPSPLKPSFQEDYGLFLGRAVSGKTDYRRVGKQPDKDTTIYVDGKGE